MARMWIERRAGATRSDVVARIYEEFPVPLPTEPLPHDALKIAYERTAALALHAFTGLAPRRLDDGSRDGAVDLALDGDDGVEAVVEVTSSADSTAERAFAMAEALVKRVNDFYDGKTHWSLHFGRNYAPPSNARKLKTCAQAVASELHAYDRTAEDYVFFSAASWLSAHRVHDGTRGVDGSSWDSRIPSTDSPFVKTLEEFLASELIGTKRKKLAREAPMVGAAERHLYVFLKLTGANAHVYPRRPAVLAVNGLQLPEGVDVLWLNLQNSFTYRYSIHAGLEVYRNVWI